MIRDRDPRVREKDLLHLRLENEIADPVHSPYVGEEIVVDEGDDLRVDFLELSHHRLGRARRPVALLAERVRLERAELAVEGAPLRAEKRVEAVSQADVPVADPVAVAPFRAVRVEGVGYRGERAVGIVDDAAAVAPGETGHVRRGARPDELPRRILAVPANDDVDVRASGEELLDVLGGESPADDRHGPGRQRPDHLAHRVELVVPVHAHEEQVRSGAQLLVEMLFVAQVDDADFPDLVLDRGGDVFEAEGREELVDRHFAVVGVDADDFLEAHFAAFVNRGAALRARAAGSIP